MVAEVIEETADSRSFVLEIPPQLAETFAYEAGQFCTFRADDRRSRGGAQLLDVELARRGRRLCRHRQARARGPDVELDDRRSSAVGDRIDTMRPAGLFVLGDAETPIVAFAGGSGITPVLSVIKSALATTTRQIRLDLRQPQRGLGDLRRRALERSARSGGRPPCTTTSTPMPASSTPLPAWS